MTWILLLPDQGRHYDGGSRAQEVPEEEILEAILFGHEEIKKLVAFQEEIKAEIGKPMMEVEARRAGSGDYGRR